MIVSVLHLRCSGRKMKKKTYVHQLMNCRDILQNRPYRGLEQEENKKES
jgi:hypothetical protein